MTNEFKSLRYIFKATSFWTAALGIGLRVKSPVCGHFILKSIPSLYNWLDWHWKTVPDGQIVSEKFDQEFLLEQVVQITWNWNDLLCFK